ncbi:MAG TPA: ribonuclease P protein component 4 [Thermoplasmata archaeon]|nr:ribonuclease P protein component 4 [Thermoplasmata archaeon]HEV2429631.1 ribonuclease P protein component 4 [Thermoplasmata archaeon]
MPLPTYPSARRGRRGRRTAGMIRLARERISTLFALASNEASGPDLTLSNRYVNLARKIGTRYNVRIPPEYRELYCRGCSRYWVEGRTVRTRLRSPLRVRTCLGCGRVRRVRIGPRRPPAGRPNPVSGISPSSEEETLAEVASNPDDEAAELGLEEEE